MTGYWPPKDPAAVEPYFIVWCDIDGTNSGAAADDGELQGATIGSVTWTVPTGITQGTAHTSAGTINGVAYGANTVATIWLSGGTAGESYPIECKIVTSDSRTLVKTVRLDVEEL